MNSDNQPITVSESGQTGVSLHSEGPATHTAKIVGGMNTQILGRHTGVVEDGARSLSPKKATLINRRAVKVYALGVSKLQKAGKFKRVGESFYIGVEAELDAKIRQLVIQDFTPPSSAGLKFTTKLAREKAAERIELLAARIIYGKVCRHPSVGVTLKD